MSSVSRYEEKMRKDWLYHCKKRLAKTNKIAKTLTMQCILPSMNMDWFDVSMGGCINVLHCEIIFIPYLLINALVGL